jgi:predicted Zn-dependent protease
MHIRASIRMHLHQGTAESEFIRVVRHETGHTLGFPHEASVACALRLLDFARPP